MGPPRQAPAPRDRLLAAADELFYSEGITSTGVDAVIARAGVATGSLYNNFGGKDALVAAYLEARDLRWRHEWEASIADALDPITRVLAIFDAMQRWTSATPAHRGCAHAAAATQVKDGSPAMTAAMAHKQHLRQRMCELVAATGVRDPVNLAQDILLLYEGMFAMLAMDPGVAPIQRARRLADALIRAEIAETR